jgi:ATP-dependent Clp protease ATP-binding subunit ClpA
MNVTVPLYVEERRGKGQPAPMFAVRPLFHPLPQRQADQLSRALSKLAQDLRKLLDGLARQPRQDVLADWTFNPQTEEHRVAFNLVLKRHTHRVRMLVVSLPALDRRLAFSPLLPELWFEVARSQRVSDRVEEVLTEHFLKLEKEDDDAFAFPPELTEYSRSWLSSLELDVVPNPELKKKTDELPFFLLGGPPVGSGREELHKVGRCLDWLFPDELDRAVLRDAEVGELTERLGDPDKRPVLLVGPRQAGKTAVVHECVYRRVEKRTSPHASKHNVWLLSPQRLISGMSYVGQWENRLLAILDEAKKSDHVLYFDDLLGLYHAGVHSKSDLSAADVLRPFVERRDVRVLGEITPEALRVLRERDRPLADLFHVLPLREASEAQTRRILISAMRQFEDRFRCRFDVEALPAVLDLQQRYVRDTALPGKAAGFLRQLAVKHKRLDPLLKQIFGHSMADAITRETVLDEFHARSGLSVTFLDGAQKLDRAEVVEALSARVVGQRAAVDAMADVVCVAKARLNDPSRPIACFLFLGPTGVGKTESAKALARYLFGGGGAGGGDDAPSTDTDASSTDANKTKPPEPDPGAGADRLLRFDMNEFVDPGSAARLVGTFHEPEGLLTGAVRRQPFCVILLDEIEKADPGVFDLLLQVLGEGRLTDARGRTADFTNAMIVMTSNLGVREASNSFGLRPAGDTASGAGSAATADADAPVYLAAAERFFRPEFFNRIDRVIPFARLTRPEVARIAQHLMNDVLGREGLVHRRCVLAIDPAALEKVVDAGYHPQLGARALKRAVERQLTQPVAQRLATMTPAAPAVINLYPAGNGIAVHVEPLTEAAQGEAPWARLPLDDPDLVLDCVEDAVVRIEEALAATEPPGGFTLTQGSVSAAQFRYLTVRDQAGRVTAMLKRIDQLLERRAAPKPRLPRYTPPPRAARRLILRSLGQSGGVLWRDLVARENLHSHLAELVDGDDAPADREATELTDRLEELVAEAALLEAMTAISGLDSDRALIFIRPVSGHPRHKYKLIDCYVALFQNRYGMTITRVEDDRFEFDGTLATCTWMLAEMPSAGRVLRSEVGTHLFAGHGDSIAPVQVSVVPVGDGQDPLDAARAHVAAWDRWRADLAAGRAKPDDNPWRLGPLVRVYDAAATVDLRTGLASRGWPEPHDFRRFVLAQLPLPRELSEIQVRSD